MTVNPGLAKLYRYPFERLSGLLKNIPCPDDLIRLSVGEPKHKPPAFVTALLREENTGLGSYPPTRGYEETRNACASWLCRRFGLPDTSITGERHVLPVNGTREALFAIAQCLIDSAENGLVMLPNPFYQIYEGAALLAGAEPFYLNCLAENDFLPDFEDASESDWRRCQLVYICSPGNPAGKVMPQEMLTELIRLAHRYDFCIISDECYSEIYLDESTPPPGLLNASLNLCDDHYSRCLALYSLSKRSNLPGMRSGFVAGDQQLIASFAKYRSYHGCAMSPLFQKLSTAAWSDEEHVRESRAAYQRKFRNFKNIVSERFGFNVPEGGFYFWPSVRCADEDFTRRLYGAKGLEVLPGSYLSRSVRGCDPGAGRVRIALVPEEKTCQEAAHRLQEFLEAEHPLH